jgi:hypothetical protein
MTQVHPGGSAFKVLKKESEALDAAIDAAIAKREAAEKLVTAPNDGIEILKAPLSAALAEVVAANASVKAIIDEMTSEWRSDLEEKSEKWRESDRGMAVEAVVESWEEFATEIGGFAVEDVDLPEELEFEMPLFDERPEDAPGAEG